MKGNSAVTDSKSSHPLPALHYASTTTVYQPRRGAPMDMVPRYYQYAFQEKEETTLPPLVTSGAGTPAAGTSISNGVKLFRPSAMLRWKALLGMNLLRGPRQQYPAAPPIQRDTFAGAVAIAGGRGAEAQVLMIDSDDEGATVDNPDGEAGEAAHSDADAEPALDIIIPPAIMTVPSMATARRHVVVKNITQCYALGDVSLSSIDELDSRAADDVPGSSGVDEECATPNEEEVELSVRDPNASAIQTLFTQWRNHSDTLAVNVMMLSHSSASLATTCNTPHGAFSADKGGGTTTASTNVVSNTTASVVAPTLFDARPTAVIPVTVRQQLTRDLSLSPVAEVQDTSTAVVAPPRSEEGGIANCLAHLRWIFYQEQYERAIISESEQQESPIAFYSGVTVSPAKGRSGRRARLCAPAFAEDSVLEGRLDAVAARAVTEMQRPRVEAALVAIARAESAEMHRAIVETQEGVKEEVAAGKRLLWRWGCTMHETLSALAHLPIREAADRLTIAEEYQCVLPPCSEGSSTGGIDAADEDSLLCSCPPDYYAAVVLGGCAALHEEMLEQHAWDLQQMHARLVSSFISLYILETVAAEEQRRWDRLLQYHAHCLKCAHVSHGKPGDVEGATALSRSRSAAGNAVVVVGEEGEEDRQASLERTWALRRWQRISYIGENDSPLCSYLLFVEVYVLREAEAMCRGRITTEENTNFAALLLELNGEHHIASQANDAREAQASLLATELVLRVFIECDQEEELHATIEAHCRAAHGTRTLEALEARRASVMNTAEVVRASICAEEESSRVMVHRQGQQRRYMLEERQSRAGLSGIQVADRWCFERSVSLLVALEERLRHRIVDEVKTWHRSTVPIYEWTTRTFLNSHGQLLLTEQYEWALLKYAVCAETQARAVLKLDAQVQRHTLFARVQAQLLTHVDRGSGDAFHGSTANSARGGASRSGASPETESGELNLRRAIIADFGSFVSDEVLTVLFWE